MDNLIEELNTKSFKNLWQRTMIKTAEIPFDESVQIACRQNFCGRYNKSWMCPPAIGDPEELRAECLSFTNAFVFTTKHVLEDSFDFEGMTAAKFEHNKVEDEVLTCFRKRKFLRLGAGGCDICDACTYPDAPCRYPEKARKTMESYGISVIDLAKNTGIKYNNGENTVTYFTMIAF